MIGVTAVVWCVAASLVGVGVAIGDGAAVRRAAAEWDPGEVCDVSRVDTTDRCAYVKTVTNCQSASKVPYLTTAYCELDGNLAPIFALLVAWLGFLFINLVLVVDARVVPNINCVAKILGMSDSLAGMTLLALGNGAADVFSSAAAVTASEDGANLAISGLLGGGLYVVVVVAGVLAYAFEPFITWKRVGIDAGWYMVAIAAVALLAADGALQVWECIVFFVVYTTYVAYSLLVEHVAKTKGEQGDPAAGPTEATALLSGATDRGDSKGVGTVATHNSIFDAVVAADALEAAQAEALARCGHATESIWTSSTHDGTWSDTLVRIGDELIKVDRTKGRRWANKSAVLKLVTILQMPVHLVLILVNPVVIYEDRGRTWDRNRHLVLSLLMLPFVVLVFDEDTFYGDNQVNVPSMAVAAAIGVVVAATVRRTADPFIPPRYQGGFAGMGFLVALTFIYLISDEVVAVLTAAGIMLSIAPSTLGMTVLGIGNGTCDLVANYLMANAGYSTTALAAVYAGPMFNLLVGLGVAGIVGAVQYGNDLSVEPELQIYIGIIFIALGLVLGVVFSTTGRFTKMQAYCFFFLYMTFLMVTVSVNVAV